MTTPAGVDPRSIILCTSLDGPTPEPEQGPEGITLTGLRTAWVRDRIRHHRAYTQTGKVPQTTIDQWATVFDQWAEHHGLTEWEAAA